VVSPTGKYTYDALYRLLSGTGRENVSLGAPGNTPFSPHNPIPLNNTGGNDLENYLQAYDYDAIGNMLSVVHTPSTSTGWTRTYAYNTSFPNNYLQSAYTGSPGSTQFTYDVHGNMLTMPHLPAMTWDFADQLKSTTKGDDTTYYAYSGGERVRKVLHGSNGKRQYERIYLGGYELYRTYDTAGTTVQLERKTYHIMDDKRKVALLEVKTIDSATPVTNPVKITRYQYTNFIDSASLELDENALIISYEEFHPFGSTAYQLHTNNSQVSLKRYRYVHKERDEETGLYYYGARYHAGWLCRFVSVDPLKDKFPFYSTYQYAGNRPINAIDLDGAESLEMDGESKGQQSQGLPAINGQIGPWSLEAVAKSELKETVATAEEVEETGTPRTTTKTLLANPIPQQFTLNNPQGALETVSVGDRPFLDRVWTRGVYSWGEQAAITLAYGVVDGVWVSGQNMIGTGPTHHLDGFQTSPDDDFWAFFGTATLLLGPALQTEVKATEKLSTLLKSTKPISRNSSLEVGLMQTESKFDHTVIGITVEGEQTQYFHQVVGRDRMARFKVLESPKHIEATEFKSIPVTNEQAKSALSTAKQMTTQSATKYNLITNSCTTCGKKVLSSGGVSTSTYVRTPGGLHKYFD